METISRTPQYLSAREESSRAAKALWASDKHVGYSKSIEQLRDDDKAIGWELGKLPSALYDAKSHILVAKQPMQDSDGIVSAEEILEHLAAADEVIRKKADEARSELAHRKRRSLLLLPELYVFAPEAITGVQGAI